MNRIGVRLSERDKALVRGDLAHGLGVYEIAKQRGISKTAIYRIRDEPALPEAPRVEASPESPAEIYRREKAKRAERLAANPQMTEAQQAFAALLQREKDAGRGGRPAGSKNGGNSLHGKLVKPGKPMLVCVRKDPLDLAPYLGHFMGSER